MNCAKLNSWVLVAVLAGTSHHAHAVVRYVALGGGNVSPYTNWADAAITIQAALDVSAAGDEILVTNGVYAGVPAGATEVAEVGTRVTLRSVPPRGAVINGNGVRRGVFLWDVQALLDGFVISNCHTTVAGAGAYLYGAGTLSNCVITCNTAADANGGGVFLYAAGSRLVDCALTRNAVWAGFGGGAYILDGGELEACVISGNRAEESGGGIYLDSTGMVRNCLITRNASDRTGGGVYLVYNQDNNNYRIAKGAVVNCTITENYAPAIAGLVCVGTAQVVNTIVYHNNGPNFTNYFAFSYTNCCTYPLAQGVGNTASDPLFLARETACFALATNSPCRNTGTNQPWMTGATDIAGDARISEDVVDMGCYELGALACAFTAVPARGLTPLPVSFAAAITGTNTAGASYLWAFGDGNTGSADQASVSNVYVTEGSFDVQVTVSNAAGATAAWYAPDCVYAYATNIHYVAADGASLFPYTTWATAATNAGDAIAAARGGHTVLITNGTYALGGEQRLAEPMRIVSVNGCDASTLVGARAAKQRCFYIDRADVVLDGLTISNGDVRVSGLYSPGYFGGGVYCNGAGALFNCRVTMCEAIDGGGVYLANGGLLSNCIVRGNTAGQHGGGVAGFAGTLYDCLLETNTITSSGWGGAGLATYRYDTTTKSISNAPMRVCRTVIRGNINHASFGGGAWLADNVLMDACSVQDNDVTQNGGGIYFYYPPTSFVTRCVISNNTSDVQGGGVYCYYGGIVEDSIICCNRTGADGGGVITYFNPSTPLSWRVRNCAIYGNYAGTQGGGAVIVFRGALTGCAVYNNSAPQGGGVVLYNGGGARNCVITSNAAQYGGGMILYYYPAEGVRSFAANCLVVSNVATIYGGGVNLINNGTMDACTIIGNMAVSNGHGIYMNGGVVSNCVVYYNGLTNVVNSGGRVCYSCIRPRLSGANNVGNITNEPGFVAAAAGDYHLLNDSPCINAGRNNGWMAGATDLADQPRIRYGTVDMGAFENQTVAPLWCAFSASTTNPVVDDLVGFSAEIDGTGSLADVWYFWDMHNDGHVDISGLAADSCSYSYTNEGVYSVKLVVSNSASMVTNQVRTNYITVVPEPVAAALALLGLVAMRSATRRTAV